MILRRNEESIDLVEKLVEYIQHRDQFMLGISDRDILETDWKQSVENAIRDSGICETEFEMIGYHLKTNSKLLQAFCPDFMDMGFMSDPSEVFWVICVNPLLTNEKKFYSRYSWEDRLNDKNTK